MSHYKLYPVPENVYVSFGGQLTKGQLRAIENLHDHLSKQCQLDVYIGVDMDNKVDEYARVIEQLFHKAKRLTMHGKDLNEQLISPTIKTQHKTGRLRLVGFES